ncbi:hypothetical protein GOP47_0003415, partial [Adiantum capillus-veneris]
IEAACWRPHWRLVGLVKHTHALASRGIYLCAGHRHSYLTHTHTYTYTHSLTQHRQSNTSLRVLAMVASAPSDPQWDSLPSHLQEFILAHLPVSEHLRLRSINRTWLSILSSSHFRSLHRRLHPHLHPSFLVYNHAVKISVLQWQTPHPAEESATDAAAVPSWGDFSLPAPFVREWVGGALSLVCVRNHLTSKAFSVGCPYSNQWKTLPDPPRAPLLSRLWAMVPHKSTNSTSKSIYSIILLQLNTPSLYMDIYNSEKNTWTQRMVPKGDGGKGSLIAFSSSAASIGGLVYSIQAESRSVVTYDVQKDVWMTLEAKLPENLVFQVPKEGGRVQAMPQVIQGCKGKVLLIGTAEASASTSGNDRASSDDNGVDAGAVVNDINAHTESSSIINLYAVVWELDWSTKMWREVARAPSQMCKHMLEEAMESRKAGLTPVKFAGHAELVVVMASGSHRALQFDVIEERWTWLDLPAAVNCEMSLCVDPISVESF